MSQPPDENHDDAADLVIARALNQELDAGVGQNLDDEAIDEYRTALSHLAADEIAPPAGLEERVVAAAIARRPAAVPSLDTARARRRATLRWVSVAAAAVAAAVIVAVLVTGGSSGNGAPTGRIVTVGATQSDLADVLGTPGTRTAVLRPDPEIPIDVANVALARDGRGYVYDVVARSGTPGDEWLWLETSGEPARIGPIVAGDPIAFLVNGDVSAVEGAFLTREPTGATPTRPSVVIARGTLAP